MIVTKKGGYELEHQDHTLEEETPTPPQIRDMFAGLGAILSPRRARRRQEDDQTGDSHRSPLGRLPSRGAHNRADSSGVSPLAGATRNTRPKDPPLSVGNTRHNRRNPL